MHLQLSQLVVNIFLVHVIKVILTALIVVVKAILAVNLVRIEIFALIECILIIFFDFIVLFLGLFGLPLFLFFFGLNREVLVCAIIARGIGRGVSILGISWSWCSHFIFCLRIT